MFSFSFFTSQITLHELLQSARGFSIRMCTFLIIYTRESIGNISWFFHERHLFAFGFAKLSILNSSLGTFLPCLRQRSAFCDSPILCKMHIRDLASFFFPFSVFLLLSHLFSATPALINWPLGCSVSSWNMLLGTLTGEIPLLHSSICTSLCNALWSIFVVYS